MSSPFLPRMSPQVVPPTNPIPRSSTTNKTPVITASVSPQSPPTQLLPPLPQITLDFSTIFNEMNLPPPCAPTASQPETAPSTPTLAPAVVPTSTQLRTAAPTPTPKPQAIHPYQAHQRALRFKSYDKIRNDCFPYVRSLCDEATQTYTAYTMQPLVSAAATTSPAPQQRYLQATHDALYPQFLELCFPSPGSSIAPWTRTYDSAWYEFSPPLPQPNVSTQQQQVDTGFKQVTSLLEPKLPQSPHHPDNNVFENYEPGCFFASTFSNNAHSLPQDHYNQVGASTPESEHFSIAVSQLTPWQQQLLHNILNFNSTIGLHQVGLRYTQDALNNQLLQSIPQTMPTSTMTSQTPSLQQIPYSSLFFWDKEISHINHNKAHVSRVPQYPPSTNRPLQNPLNISQATSNTATTRSPLIALLPHFTDSPYTHTTTLDIKQLPVITASNCLEMYSKLLPADRADVNDLVMYNLAKFYKQSAREIGKYVSSSESQNNGANFILNQKMFLPEDIREQITFNQSILATTGIDLSLNTTNAPNAVKMTETQRFHEKYARFLQNISVPNVSDPNIIKMMSNYVKDEVDYKVDCILHWFKGKYADIDPSFEKTQLPIPEYVVSNEINIKNDLHIKVTRQQLFFYYIINYSHTLASIDLTTLNARELEVHAVQLQKFSELFTSLLQYFIINPVFLHPQSISFLLTLIYIWFESTSYNCHHKQFNLISVHIVQWINTLLVTIISSTEFLNAFILPLVSHPPTQAQFGPHNITPTVSTSTSHNTSQNDVFYVPESIPASRFNLGQTSPAQSPSTSLNPPNTITNPMITQNLLHQHYLSLPTFNDSYFFPQQPQSLTVPTPIPLKSAPQPTPQPQQQMAVNPLLTDFKLIAPSFHNGLNVRGTKLPPYVNASLFVLLSYHFIAKQHPQFKNMALNDVIEQLDELTLIGVNNKSQQLQKSSVDMNPDALLLLLSQCNMDILSLMQLYAPAIQILSNSPVSMILDPIQQLFAVRKVYSTLYTTQYAHRGTMPHMLFYNKHFLQTQCGINIENYQFYQNLYTTITPSTLTQNDLNQFRNIPTGVSYYGQQSSQNTSAVFEFDTREKLRHATFLQHLMNSQTAHQNTAIQLYFLLSKQSLPLALLWSSRVYKHSEGTKTGHNGQSPLISTKFEYCNQLPELLLLLIKPYYHWLTTQLMALGTTTSSSTLPSAILTVDAAQQHLNPQLSTTHGMSLVSTNSHPMIKYTNDLLYTWFRLVQPWEHQRRTIEKTAQTRGLPQSAIFDHDISPYMFTSYIISLLPLYTITPRHIIRNAIRTIVNNNTINHHFFIASLTYDAISQEYLTTEGGSGDVDFNLLLSGPHTESLFNFVNLKNIIEYHIDPCLVAYLSYLSSYFKVLANEPDLRVIIRHWERRHALANPLSTRGTSGLQFPSLPIDSKTQSKTMMHQFMLDNYNYTQNSGHLKQPQFVPLSTSNDLFLANTPVQSNFGLSVVTEDFSAPNSPMFGGTGVSTQFLLKDDQIEPPFDPTMSTIAHQHQYFGYFCVHKPSTKAEEEEVLYNDIDPKTGQVYPNTAFACNNGFNWSYCMHCALYDDAEFKDIITQYNTMNNTQINPTSLSRSNSLMNTSSSSFSGGGSNSNVSFTRPTPLASPFPTPGHNNTFFPNASSFTAPSNTTTTPNGTNSQITVQQLLKMMYKNNHLPATNKYDLYTNNHPQVQKNIITWIRHNLVFTTTAFSHLAVAPENNGSERVYASNKLIHRLYGGLIEGKLSNMFNSILGIFQSTTQHSSTTANTAIETAKVLLNKSGSNVVNSLSAQKPCESVSSRFRFNPFNTAQRRSESEVAETEKTKESIVEKGAKAASKSDDKKHQNTTSLLSTIQFQQQQQQLRQSKLPLPQAAEIKAAEQYFIQHHLHQFLTPNSNGAIGAQSDGLLFPQNVPPSPSALNACYSPFLNPTPISYAQYKYWRAYYAEQPPKQPRTTDTTVTNGDMVQWLDTMFTTTNEMIVFREKLLLLQIFTLNSVYFQHYNYEYVEKYQKDVILYQESILVRNIDQNDNNNNNLLNNGPNLPKFNPPFAFPHDKIRSTNNIVNYSNLPQLLKNLAIANLTPQANGDCVSSKQTQYVFDHTVGICSKLISQIEFLFPLPPIDVNAVLRSYTSQFQTFSKHCNLQFLFVDPETRQQHNLSQSASQDAFNLSVFTPHKVPVFITPRKGEEGITMGTNKIFLSPLRQRLLSPQREIVMYSPITSSRDHIGTESMDRTMKSTSLHDKSTINTSLFLKNGKQTTTALVNHCLKQNTTPSPFQQIKLFFKQTAVQVILILFIILISYLRMRYNARNFA